MTFKIVALAPLVDQATADKREEEKWGIPKSTYASGLNNCLRQQWYSRKGYEEFNPDHRASWTRNAYAGTAMHLTYQDLFRRAGIVAETQDILNHAGYKIEDFSDHVRDKGLPDMAEELPIPLNEYGIGGKADGIAKLTEPIETEEYGIKIPQGEFVVVEIKTVKEKFFKNMPNNDKWPGYYSQVQLYMFFYNIRWTILFIVNRNDDDIKEFLVPYDEEYVSARLDRALRIKQHVNDNTVPVAEASFKNCHFCGFKDICRAQVEIDGGANIVYVDRKDESTISTNVGSSKNRPEETEVSDYSL